MHRTSIALAPSFCRSMFDGFGHRVYPMKAHYLKTLITVIRFRKFFSVPVLVSFENISSINLERMNNRLSIFCALRDSCRTSNLSQSKFPICVLLLIFEWCRDRLQSTCAQYSTSTCNAKLVPDLVYIILSWMVYNSQTKLPINVSSLFIVVSKYPRCWCCTFRFSIIFWKTFSFICTGSQAKRYGVLILDIYNVQKLLIEIYHESADSDFNVSLWKENSTNFSSLKRFSWKIHPTKLTTLKGL